MNKLSSGEESVDAWPAAYTSTGTLPGEPAGATASTSSPETIVKLVAANPNVYLATARKSSITLTSGIPTRRPRLGISSVVGVVGALETAARALAMELAPIRVNVIVLGSIRTELTERLGGELLEVWSQRTLGKEIGTPEEAAEAYLLSMRSGFVTGQDIVVDGGAVYL